MSLTHLRKDRHALQTPYRMYELLDSPQASGAIVADYLKAIDPECTVKPTRWKAPRALPTWCVRIPGAHGKSSGGDAPTIGLLGRLGGLGARPERIGFVSDGGALTRRLRRKAARHAQEGRHSAWRRVREHACVPACAHHAAQARAVHGLAHQPRPSMPKGHARLDAILVVDTTKGNRIANNRGFAISPTVKQGVVMRVSRLAGHCRNRHGQAAAGVRDFNARYHAPIAAACTT